MNSLIRGLGTAIPEHSIAQEDTVELARSFVYGNDDNVDALPMLFRLTKVHRRSSVLLEAPNGKPYRQSFYPAAMTSDDRGPSTGKRMQRFAEEAPGLALVAAQRALKEASMSSDEITHLVTVSCTGFYSPGVDVALINQLGLPSTVGRLNVGFMGCHGSLNGMRVVKAFAESDPSARVLMCAVELCSLHYFYGWDSEKVVANALFADGAGALVAQARAKTGDEWKLADCSSLLVPDSEDAMSWTVGDHGFEMTLSPRVPNLINEKVLPWLNDWLAKHGLKIDDVASWAIHPGGPRIIQSVASALDLSKSATEVSSRILGDFGNMSSATILFVIQQLQQQQASRPCVALAFGPGLIAEAALFL